MGMSGNVRKGMRRKESKAPVHRERGLRRDALIEGRELGPKPLRRR